MQVHAPEAFGPGRLSVVVDDLGLVTGVSIQTSPPITAQPDKPSYRPRKPRRSVESSKGPITSRRRIGRVLDTATGEWVDQWETVASW